LVEPSQAESWVLDTASLIKNLSISSSDFDFAKAALKQSVVESFDDSSKLVDELGNQTILGGKVASVEEINALIDQVSESDVLRAGQVAFSSKPTVVAYGDVSYVPHYDDIVAALH
jgi:predicted Zn-dependent peptidase